MPFFVAFQIIAINGISLVGLPLSACQNYIKVKMLMHIPTKKLEAVR